MDLVIDCSIMAEKVTYKQRIVPSKRSSLADYFKVSNQYYPGYIKQDVFKSKMRNVFYYAYSECVRMCNSPLPQKQDPTNKTLVSPYEYLVPAPNETKDIRSFIIILIDTIEWRPSNAMQDMSSNLKKLKEKHLRAAVAEPVFQVVGGKAVKWVGKQAAKGATKLVESDKVNAKVGTVVTKLTTTYEYKPRNFKNEIVGFNATEWVGDFAINSFKPEGVSASFSNDMTIGWLQKNTGMPKELAAFVMDAIDLGASFFPVVTVTKGVEDCLANLYLSYMYWDQEKTARKVEEHFNKIWKEFTSKLKTYLKKDIWSLNDNELEDLYKLLNN